MHWRRQGDLGELSAMEWFESKGAGIYFPIGHSPHSDFIAEFDDDLARVQVKTCIAFRLQRWQVTICTRGGNQSWSGLVKHFDPARCDYLFVVVGDGRRWCIPSKAIACGRGIALGGPKYREFEVESGRPLPDPYVDGPASTIGSSDARGDVRVAKGARL
jgi:hypothetical protein